MTIQSGSSLLQRPGTKLGWWAVGLAAVFVVMFTVISVAAMPISELPIWMQFPFYYITFMSLCGLAAGVVGLIAVIRKHERSWLVWLAILAGALMLLSILSQYV